MTGYKQQCNFPSEEVCPGQRGFVVRRQQLVAWIPQRHLINNCPWPTPQPPEQEDTRTSHLGQEWPRPTPNLPRGAIQQPIYQSQVPTFARTIGWCLVHQSRWRGWSIRWCSSNQLNSIALEKTCSPHQSPRRFSLVCQIIYTTGVT